MSQYEYIDLKECLCTFGALPLYLFLALCVCGCLHTVNQAFCKIWLELVHFLTSRDIFIQMLYNVLQLLASKVKHPSIKICDIELIFLV